MSTWGAPVKGCLCGMNMLIMDLNNAPPGSNQGQTIDVEAIEDDVIESSPTEFEEAKSRNPRKKKREEAAVDKTSQQTLDSKRRKSPANPTNISGQKVAAKPSVPVPPPKPKEPAFSCPICFNSPVEEMSTKCGHIFCNACIKTALTKRKECPTCRAKVSARGLRRVFLPSTR